MDETASTWSTPRELVQLVLAPQHLKRTVSVALIVGTVFFAMNQLGVILARPRNRGGLAQGRADIPDSAARLQFRASVGHTTAYRPAHLTVGAMSGNRRSPPTQQVLTT